MDSQVHVGAGWALWGKHPGSNDDYSVLASSAEPLSAAEFASVLTHFAPGTPPAERGLPSSLPWVILSRFGIEERPYIGMAIQSPTDEADGAGRPITRTSYFCVPYAELESTPVSYASLYQALVSIQLPHHGGDLVQLSLPRLDPAALAADITGEFGEQAVAAAGAWLLCGPVTVTGSDSSTAYDRLRYLDAVAALLPYGYRTDYTAATWSDSGARHQIRLAFASTARADAGVIRWRSVPDGPAGRNPGEAYFRLLRQIRERRPGQGELAELIGFLAQDTAPGLFERPQPAVERLREFDLPAIVLSAVLDRTAHIDEVRAIFTRSRVTELPPEGRQALLAELLRLGGPQDWPTIRKWWDTVVGDDPAVMLPVLVNVCRRLLWAQAPSLAIRDHLTLAAQYGLIDGLLAALVALPDSEFEMRGGLSAAAQLLADWVLTGAGDGFPHTQRAMAGNRLLACELLAQQAGSQQATRAALTWLEPALGGFLRPFLVVLSEAPGTVDQLAVGQLAHYNVTCVRALLQAASFGGHLQLVLPGFTGWLARSTLEHGGLDDVARQYWYEVAWALTAAAPVAQAWLDLAMLVTGNDPRFLLAAADRPGVQQYNDCFAAAWSELLAGAGQAIDDRLTAALIRYLDQASWTADAWQVDVVVDLATRLTGAGRRTRLESAIADSLLARREAAEREPAQAWLALVRPAPAGVSVDDILPSLRHPRPDLSEAQLAELCVRGFQAGLDPRDVGQALADSGVINSGVRAADFLNELRSGLYAVSAGRQNPLNWVRWFIGWLADGTFGLRVAEEFRKVAVEDAYEDIRYRLDVLFIAATGGRQDSPLTLSDAEIEQTDWISRSFEYILKEAKKRPGRQHRLRGGKHNRDETDPGHDTKNAREPGGGQQHDADHDRAGQAEGRPEAGRHSRGA